MEKAPLPMAETCETCRYRIPADGTGYDGYCRRYPPVAATWRPSSEYPGETTAFFFWPEVDPTDWCGEWKARTA